ncbi:deoxyguanosinetriphosphate triphosphohydrolase [Pedomonas sp. V897]|uniref:deoxyguanosinetriphosphate triphosphohydrolase n=1 Tax=Pedomonas sp. V897 TaxID=3446482 RepID=UPI003EE182B6
MSVYAPRERLAPYAADPSRSRGRLHPQEESPGRTAFQRDRDRIIHSTAFRRMKHKTQVFVSVDGDHYRTRLTHSLEVAQIARSIARRLGLDEDLTEALALAHDLGHTAFGHAGEEALADKMAAWGGFDHNANTIRIVTRLEHRYVAFDGLNLTWETLEGLAKHNGPVANPPWALAEYVAEHDLELDTYASLEAQVASLSDDIAYNTHDVDDGLRAGLFTIDDLMGVPLVAETWARLTRRYPGAPHDRLRAELIRSMVSHLVLDLLAETQARLDALQPQSADDIRRAGHPVAAFSEAARLQERELKHFLRARMYRHYKVEHITDLAKGVIADLFDLYLDDPMRMPPEWSSRAARAAMPDRVRTVADFIAGMTDNFALRELARLTGRKPIEI